jgi:hypothetical protein
VVNLARIIVATLLLAVAALAFAPNYYVVVDGGVVYDEAHNYEDDHVVGELPYWTPVEAEPVGSPESARTYCYVKLADGRAGLTEWDNLGWALRAAGDDVPIFAEADEGEVKGRLARGDVVAFILVDGEVAIDYYGVTTAERLEGWVRKSDVEPLVPRSD